MDTGEGYHFDIEYTISLKKHLDGDIIVHVNCNQDNSVGSNRLSPDKDVGVCLKLMGMAMRRHYDSRLKEKFMEWINAKEPLLR